MAPPVSGCPTPFHAMGWRSRPKHSKRQHPPPLRAGKVLVYGIAKGNLEHVFSGDEPGRHTGELLGHTGVITALFFYKHMVYTGSMDCTVQVRQSAMSSTGIFTIFTGHKN